MRDSKVLKGGSGGTGAVHGGEVEVLEWRTEGSGVDSKMVWRGKLEVVE